MYLFDYLVPERKLSFPPPASAGRQTQILTRLRRANPRNTQCIPAVNPAGGIVFFDLNKKS